MLAEFPSAIILRPSIVFGAEDEFFNRFAALARISPALPLIGGGTHEIPAGFRRRRRAGGAQTPRSAPATPARIYEIGGPEVFSFRDVLELTLRYTGRRRLLLPMPFWLAKLQALATSPLPNIIAADHPRSGSPSEVRQCRLRSGQA